MPTETVYVASENGASNWNNSANADTRWNDSSDATTVGPPKTGPAQAYNMDQLTFSGTITEVRAIARGNESGGDATCDLAVDINGSIGSAKNYDWGTGGYNDLTLTWGSLSIENSTYTPVVTFTPQNVDSGNNFEISEFELEIDYTEPPSVTPITKTATLLPDGNGTGGSDFGNINNGVDTPVDGSTVTLDASGTVFYTLDDVPADFAYATDCTVRIRASQTGSAATIEISNVRLYESDETSAITQAGGAVTLTGSLSDTETTSTPNAVNNLKASWTGATLAITVSEYSGTDSITISEVEAEVTYVPIGNKTVFLYPDGNGTGGTDFGNINNGVSTPVDGSTVTTSAATERFYTLDDVPADFQYATNVTIRTRYKQATAGASPVFLNGAILKESDESSDITYTTGNLGISESFADYEAEVPLTNVPAAIGPTDMNGAIIMLDIYDGGGPDHVLSEVEVEVTYQGDSENNAAILLGGL